MIRDEFERLLSDWLDEPLRADLREIIENAAAGSPDLAAIRDDWRRVHALTWDKPIELLRIDWEQSARSIAARIDADVTHAEKADELDSILKLAIAPVELSVDWRRFAARIGEAIDQSVAAELAPSHLDDALRHSPSGIPWKQERERIALATHTIERSRPKRARTIRMASWISGLAAAAAIGWLFIRALGPQAGTGSATIVANTVIEAPMFAEVAVDSLDQTAIGDGASVTVAVADSDFDYAESHANDGHVAASADDFYFSISPARGAAGM